VSMLNCYYHFLALQYTVPCKFRKNFICIRTATELLVRCAAAQGMQLQLGVVRVELCGTWCKQGQIA
jgi:hypothetical protein